MVSILIVKQDLNPAPNAEPYHRFDDCLASIRQKTTVPFEVIVVENTCLEDEGHGSLNGLAQTYPWVKFFSGIDLSFAAATNLAASHASGEYLLLLSSDAVLRTDIVDAVEVLKGDLSIGAVGAEKCSHDGQHRVSCAFFPTPLRLWRFASMWHIPDVIWKHVNGVPVRLSDYVDISFLLTRANAWRAVGGMDERNRLYGDEMDYCRTLFNRGLLTVHCQTVVYAHGGEYSPARLGFLIGGFRRYHRRFSGPLTRLRAEFALRAGLAMRLPVYWLKSRRGDAEARLALSHSLHLYRHWNDSVPGAERYTGPSS